MRRGAALALTTLLALGCAPAPTSTPPATGVAASASPRAPAGPPAIDGTRAKAHVEFLADPARGGRLTGSSGYAASAEYVAARFAQAGLEPLGDAGGFLQRITVPLVDLAATPVLERVGAGARPFTHRTDFVEVVGVRGGGGDVTGELVFAGAGLRIAGYDDFAGLPVSGAVVLLVGGAPGVDLLRNAATAGAKAVIAIGGSSELFKPSYFPVFEADALPTVVATHSAVSALLAPTGRTAEELRSAALDRARAAAGGEQPSPPGFVAGFRVRVAVPLTPLRRIETVNVVGGLVGSDADAAKRAVVVGGHLDGVGTDPNGTVFRGANDNASGPSIVMEIARVAAMDRAALKRTVIFVAFAGEEQGLLGSAAFLERMGSSRWPPASMVAFFNLDVAGCCGTRLSASTEDQDIVDRVRAAADVEGVPFTSGGHGGGSDQATFQRRSIPATMVAWTDPGPLHTTRDVPSIVDEARLADAGRVVLRAVRELAAIR